ncbi:helix-turn-helix domain-containing protein [Ruegeria pomeroyi]|nr:helix-turn-helix domain-containing protein [Ruegeria pomeroyi]
MTLNRFDWLKSVMRSDVSPSAKNVATVLAVQFANDETGQLNPSRDTLADYLNVHRDTIKRAIRELRNAGWLIVFEGRGRGNSSGFRLVSPGKVVAITAAKKRADLHREKGADMHPYSEEKGADLHRKGGRFAPSYIRQEQSIEQRAREAKAGGCPVDRLSRIDPGSYRVTAWDEWLTERGWPCLADLQVKQEGGYLVPYAMPPEDPDGAAARVTNRYLSWACNRGSERHEASA